jgi:hypothetical protein
VKGHKDKGRLLTVSSPVHRAPVPYFVREAVLIHTAHQEVRVLGWLDLVHADSVLHVDRWVGNGFGVRLDAAPVPQSIEHGTAFRPL